VEDFIIVDMTETDDA